jgi:integrase
MVGVPARQWTGAPAFLRTLQGLRHGEVLGLRWQDVDLDADQPTLRISSTRVQVTARQEATGEPKTARGRRVLPILHRLPGPSGKRGKSNGKSSVAWARPTTRAGWLSSTSSATRCASERYGDAFRR